jgi:hypothetical protein
MLSRCRLLALIAAAGLIPLGLSGTAVAAQSQNRVFKAEQSVLTAPQVRRLAANATDRSIITFKNQFPNLPMRGSTGRLRVSAVNAAQAPVLAELARLHAPHVEAFQIINAIAATISPAEVQRLRANSAVAAVEPDTLQHPASQGAGMADNTVAANDAVTANHGVMADDALVADHGVAAGHAARSRSARATRPSR